MVAAGMVGRVGTGESLAWRHAGVALARVPHCTRIPAAWPRACAVVEAVGLARVVVATRSGKEVD